MPGLLSNCNLYSAHKNHLLVLDANFAPVSCLVTLIKIGFIDNNIITYVYTSFLNVECCVQTSSHILCTEVCKFT